MKAFSIILAAGILLCSARQAYAEEVTETQKILVLISTVADLKDAVFIKDGRAISGAVAAEWMRQDPELREKMLPSARSFLSRVSGSAEPEPYRIQWKDGKTMLVSALLNQVLERLESIPPDAE